MYYAVNLEGAGSVNCKNATGGDDYELMGSNYFPFVSSRVHNWLSSIPESDTFLDSIQKESKRPGSIPGQQTEQRLGFTLFSFLIYAETQIKRISNIYFLFLLN